MLKPQALFRRATASARIAALLSLLSLLSLPATANLAGAGAPLTCQPPAGGSTCDPGNGPAVLAGIGNGGVKLGVGNPINLVTGNKHQRETDMAALPGVLGVEIVRHYNSAYSREHSRSGILGRGWKLSYETTLHIGPRKLQILQADGSRVVFERDPREPDQCATENPAHGTLHIGDDAAGRHYLWQWPDGQRMRFDTAGRLIRITAASGEFVSLIWRADGALLQVTDPQGRSLRLSYPPPGSGAAFRGVRHIDSPLGRFSYMHGDDDAAALKPAGATAAQPRAAILRAVQRPPASAQHQRIERRYHYEDERHPALLTGISVVGSGSDGEAMDLRIASWAYDERGRAIRSVRGAPDSRLAEVRLRYLRPATAAADGVTEVRNSLGQLTRYRHRIIGGEFRLTEALGPGCASCSPGNRRYLYDTAGRLLETAVLAPDMAEDDIDRREPQVRAVLRNQFDLQGRVLSVEYIDHGKPGSAAPAAHLLQRFEYGDPLWPQRPTRILRPSVVSGQNHVLERRFNAHGQLTELIETGFSPRPLDLDQPAAGDAVPQPIERRLKLDYQLINGRSVLVAVDGPLPNGPLASPADSDLTLFHWDDRGDFVHSVLRPGARRTRIEHDPGSGLPLELHDEDGHAVRFDYDVFGEVRAQHSSPPAGAPLVHAWLRNALGEETIFGSGNPDDGDFRPRVRRAYDPGGKLLWSADALGILHRYRHDSEGRLLEVSRSSASMRQTQTLPAAAAHPDTARPAAHAAAIAADTDPAADATKNGAFHPRHQIDDFGRVVATLSPDSGETRRSFDAASRLVSMRDANGHLAHYAYTVDGRIARQTIIDARDGSSTLTHWEHRGRHLLRIDHPEQRESFEYDSRGLPTARLLSLPTAAGERHFALRHEHDDAGRLVASTLADGSRIRFLRNAQDQVVAIERDAVRTTWLRALVGPQRIVSDLQRDLVGVRSQRAGNGVLSLQQRSAEGLLGRIVHRLPDDAKAASPLRAAIGEAQAAAGSTAADDAPGAFGIPSDPHALLDLRLLWDKRGNLLHQQRFPAAFLASQAYDGSNRLIASLHQHRLDQDTALESWRYAYDRHGRRVLAQQDWPEPQQPIAGTVRSHYQTGSHRRADFRYSAAGEVLDDGARSYDWDAFGRLAAVHQNGKTLARYRYDHRGLRIQRVTDGGTEHYLYDDTRRLIAHLDAAGRITRQYLYLGDTPLAFIDSPHGITASTGALASLLHDLRALAASWLGKPRERLYWVHANHLGAPEAISDVRAQVVWRAHYAPFGSARVEQGKGSDFRFDLRLPGQIFDAETGLHYNRARYYDPARGQYLSPDPLGTPDGPDSYAYVAFNPLRFIDPDGLALFAFDGTGHHDRNPNERSNVFDFHDAYDSGTSHYVSGVGTRHRDERYGDIRYPILAGGHLTDSINNYTGPKRIERMVMYLMDEADTTEDHHIMTVDIIGYSRGAAQARDFANRIAAATRDGVYYYSRPDALGEKAYFCQPVELRFIGLFDTVLSRNQSGLSYQLDIPDAFSHVAHAIALNEFRGDAVFFRPAGSAGDFPLESIHDAMYSPVPQAGKTRIEMGFIGSHADIGGGYAGTEGELAKVALDWMMQQAGLAGLTMAYPPTSMARDPVIHDRSNAIRSGLPDEHSEDRIVRYGSGTTTTQREMLLAAGMSFPDTLRYIAFHSRSEISGPIDVTGTVNAAEYLNWLKNNGYRLSLEVK